MGLFRGDLPIVLVRIVDLCPPPPGMRNFCRTVIRGTSMVAETRASCRF